MLVLSKPAAQSFTAFVWRYASHLSGSARGKFYHTQIARLFHTKDTCALQINIALNFLAVGNSDYTE
jgi:hypothetical protein